MASLHRPLPCSQATWHLGHALGQCLPTGTVLLLGGDLGSGKTTLVQGLGAGLGIMDPLASPTFTLINEYPEGRIPLYHIDLYRLDPAQVDQLYLEQYWSGDEVPPGIVAIEWAERLRLRPQHPIHIDLQYESHSPQAPGSDNSQGQNTLNSPSDHQVGRRVTLRATHPDHLALLHALPPTLA